MVALIRFLLSLVVVWLLGLALLSLLGLRERRWPLTYMQPAVDFAIGAAVLVTIWVLAALAGARVSPWIVYACTGLLATCSAARQWRNRKVASPSERPPPVPRWHMALAALLILLFAVATFRAGQLAFRTTMFWDGRYIWSFKARVLYSDEGIRRAPFASQARYRYTALDHPLAIPALEAWVFQSLGGIDERYGKMVALAYWLGIGAAFAAYLRRRASWPLALGLSLLVTQVPQLVLHGGSGVADVPFAFHLLAGALLLGDWFEHGRREDALTSALLFGTAALVKSEGIPLCVGVAVIFCIGWWRRRRQTTWPQLALAFSCLALPVLPWLALRRWWRIESPQVAEMLLRPWEDLWVRGVTIGEALRDHFRAWATWELCWVVVVIGLAAYLMRRPRQVATSVLWAVVLWQFAVYMTVYMVNPYTIQWTLAASLDRLLLHLMPLALAASWNSLAPARPAP